MIERPILGISMGDPFGNGPEISVKALHDPALYDRCRPLLVGDRSSMEYALKTAKKVSGIDLKLHVVQRDHSRKYLSNVFHFQNQGLISHHSSPLRVYCLL